MQRLFTHAETSQYLAQCRDLLVREYGESECSGMDHWRAHFDAGYHIRQPYGDFSTTPPNVMGMVTAMLISEAELAAMKRHERRDIEVFPWTAEDGPAVLFILSIVSEAPGIAAKCIAGMLDQVERLPTRDAIRKLGLFCTGPQGYLMSSAFGLEPAGTEYQEGWPFMERSLERGELASIGNALPEIWNMTKARDVVRRGRTQWGIEWRDHILASAELAGIATR